MQNNKNKDFIVYCDLDGVVFDIDKYVSDAAPHLTKDNDWYHYIIYPEIEKGNYFFANLPLKNDAIQLLNYLESVFDNWCYLSATGDKYVEQIELEKRLALKSKVFRTTGIDRKPYFSKSGKRKYEVMVGSSCLPKHCILVDDYAKNVDEWRKKGGKAILHTTTEATIEELRIILKNTEL